MFVGEVIGMLGGFKNVINIFVACDTDGDFVGRADVVRAEQSALKSVRVREGCNKLTKLLSVLLLLHN